MTSRVKLISELECLHVNTIQCCTSKTNISEFAQYNTMVFDNNIIHKEYVRELTIESYELGAITREEYDLIMKCFNESQYYPILYYFRFITEEMNQLPGQNQISEHEMKLIMNTTKENTL